MTAAAKSRSLYLVHPLFDSLTMGLGSLLLLVPFFIFQNQSFNDRVAEISIVLLWIGNWPHFASTFHLLYSSRDNLQQYPLTCIALPIAMLTLALYALQAPQTVGTLLIKVYTIWAPYHFCGQSLGVALLYAYRANVRLDPSERRSLSMMLYGTFFVLVARGESKTWVQKFNGISFSSLGAPQWFVWIAYLWLGISTIAFLFLYFRAIRRGRAPLPWIAFVPILAQYLWFTIGPSILPFDQLVPFFHSIQYLPIVWFMHLQEKVSQEGTQLTPRYVRRHVWSWARVNFVGGAFLFWATPILLVFFHFPYAITKPIVYATVNLHHFIVDGVIWKLRRKKVLSPLLNAIPA